MKREIHQRRVRRRPVQIVARESYPDDDSGKTLTGINYHGAILSLEQVEFGRAMHAEELRLGKVSLSSQEILEVAKRLGYKKNP